MTTKHEEAALPQLKGILGRAAAGQIVREGKGGRYLRRRRFHRWGWPDRARTRLVATFAVMTVAAVVAVSAGAFDRSPVAPQLGPADSGVKPGVVPAEVEVLHGPNGEKIYGGVSPCIKSDPAGYSDAELNDPEWCFHKPGEGKEGPKPGGLSAGVSTGKQEPRFKVWRRGQLSQPTP
jgi:hypothetical protein